MSKCAMRRGAQACIGVFLLAVSSFGLIYACRTAVAQALYREAKFGASAADPDRILDLCARSWRLYPRGYYLAVWAAKNAWINRSGAGGAEQPARVEQTREWCERGLTLNPFNTELRELKTRLLQRDSPAAAVTYWAKHVEWAFWDPWNHALLAELQAVAGDYTGALDALAWAEGSQFYEPARLRVLAVWREEREIITPAGRPPAPRPR